MVAEARLHNKGDLFKRLIEQTKRTKDWQSKKRAFITNQHSPKIPQPGQGPLDNPTPLAALELPSILGFVPRPPSPRRMGKEQNQFLKASHRTSLKIFMPLFHNNRFPPFKNMFFIFFGQAPTSWPLLTSSLPKP